MPAAMRAASRWTTPAFYMCRSAVIQMLERLAE
jgi:hypothetical protein